MVNERNTIITSHNSGQLTLEVYVFVKPPALGIRQKIDFVRQGIPALDGGMGPRVQFRLGTLQANIG